ncbi:hypothetical protein MRX96_034426 [Rhipicephalus microplus]
MLLTHSAFGAWFRGLADQRPDHEMRFDYDVPGARAGPTRGSAAKYLRRKRSREFQGARIFVILFVIVIAAEVNANRSLTIPTVGFAAYKEEKKQTSNKKVVGNVRLT